MRRVGHVIGTSPEQIRETDAVFARYFVGLYDDIRDRVYTLGIDFARALREVAGADRRYL